MTDETENELLASEISRLKEELSECKRTLETTRADRDRLLEEIEVTNARFYNIADPLDAGRLRLDFERFDHDQNEIEVRQLTADWQKKFTLGRYQEIIESVMKEIPIKTTPPLPDAECERLASYYLASILTKQMRFDEANHYAQNFDYPAPSNGSDFLPYNLKQSTRLSRWRRANASMRGHPGFLINSMPKSASSFLCNALAELLRVPISRVSLGNGVRRFVVEKWARIPTSQA